MPKTIYTERDIDELHARGVTSLEVNDNRFPVQPATLAKRRSVNENCIRRPQCAISGVDVAEYMESRPGF